MAVTGGEPAARFRNGSPWRDPDVLQVLAVGVVATAATCGGAYAWALARTLRTARQARRDPADAASVVLFGKRLVDGRPDPEFRWRLRHALRLLRSHPHLVVLLSGGRSSGPDAPSEAEIARRWLLRRMPEAAPRLLVEEGSLDTVANLRHARALLPPGKVALLSNRYHLARCALLARTLGLEVHCVGAEPRLRLDRPTRRRLALEAGYHTLFVVGLGWARLLRNRRMLARVT
jgi:uncharacterized SAM-binding protein YcdF (DUF218 family)